MKFQFGLIVLLVSLSTIYSECIQNESHLASNNVLVGNKKPLSIESLNSKDIIQVALNATHLHNILNNSTKNYYKLVCIKSGTSQIVNGIVYRFDVTLQKTNCFKNDVVQESQGFLTVEHLNNIENCKLTDEKVETVLSVNSRPWMKTEPYILN